MYHRIGANYDATRRADPYIVQQITRHLSVEPGGRYLDVACGTGNYSGALAGQGGVWVGMDVTPSMIGRAREKTLAVHWSLARAENLPFVGRAFSGALCVLALHHFAELGPIFRDIHRVLDRGKLVIFTSDPGQMRDYWLNEYFPEAMRKSIEQMPTLARVSENLSRAGFADIETATYEVRDDLRDMFLYSGKHRPQLYLDEGFHAGISTFAGLASPEEVREGCARLALDVESGRISEVVDRYRSRSGDYMFIIGLKND